MVEAAIAFLFGLLIGSFLNVCIYRWPRDLSVVRPRSHCPACETTIVWHDNIPLLSYLLLRGRCRKCGAHISPRYPAVELITGLVFFLLVWRSGFTPLALKYCVLGAILIALTFCDVEERILPDELTLGGLLAGIIFAFFVGVPDFTAHFIAAILSLSLGPRALSVAEALAGAILPAGSLWLGGVLYEKIRHREGLGLGDVKMIAMVGAFLGVRGALLTLILGSMLGSIVGIIYIKVTKQDMSTYQLPLGTFLGIAALAVIAVGKQVMDWYAGLM